MCRIFRYSQFLGSPSVWAKESLGENYSQIFSANGELLLDEIYFM